MNCNGGCCETTEREGSLLGVLGEAHHNSFLFLIYLVHFMRLTVLPPVDSSNLGKDLPLLTILLLKRNMQHSLQ